MLTKFCQTEASFCAAAQTVALAAVSPARPNPVYYFFGKRFDERFKFSQSKQRADDVASHDVTSGQYR